MSLACLLSPENVWRIMKPKYNRDQGLFSNCSHISCVSSVYSSKHAAVQECGRATEEHVYMDNSMFMCVHNQLQVDIDVCVSYVLYVCKKNRFIFGIEIYCLLHQSNHNVQLRYVCWIQHSDVIWKMLEQAMRQRNVHSHMYINQDTKELFTTF